LIPSTLHMLVPALLNAAMFLVFFAYIQRLRKPDERRYYNFIGAYNARIATWGMIIQPFIGIFYLLIIYHTNRTIFQNIMTGLAAPYFWSMVGLCITALILSIIYLKLGWERGRTLIVIAGLLMIIAFPLGGYNREKARKPFLIYGVMYMNERVVATGPAGTFAVQTSAIIPTGPMIKPEEPRPISAEKSGAMIIQEYHCRVCHTIQGRGGSVGPHLVAKLIEKKFHGDRDKVKQFLRSPPGVMPPFDGSATELDSLATYLLQLQ
jgi:mono/diheme cytochrome c family protein